MSKEITIQGLNLTVDDLDTLSRLAESDGQTTQLWIEDKSFVKELISTGWAIACNKDWVFGTKKLRAIMPEIRAKLLAQNL